MSKIKNEDYIQDASDIVARFDSLSDINIASTALLKLARTAIENNDGRWAFEKAHLAVFMHEHVTGNRLE